MTMEQKPRRHFHDELDTLQKRLMEMAGIVERIVARAIEAVLDRDPAVAPAVMDEDDRVDELEVEIDARVMELLALHQPMASDLRQIIATNKVANDLERMGDHAVNMAKAARRLSDTAPLPELRELREMAEITKEMLADALAAFVTRNAGTARMVCITDDKVDNLRRSLFRILVTHMLEDPKRIGGALELLLVSQNLERIADLSTNISEDVVFLVEGRTIKHGAEGHRVADNDEDDALE
ncbi:MAG: phosphate transport system regulatory protein PhoU [Gemmatimonadota bacterium]